MNKKCIAKLLLEQIPKAGVWDLPTCPGALLQNSPSQRCFLIFSNFSPRCCFISPALKRSKPSKKWLSAEFRTGTLLLRLWDNQRKKKSQKTKIQTTLLFLGLAGKQRTTFVTFQRGCEDQNSSVSLDRCHWKLCKPGQSCGTAPGTPLAPEQRAEQRWWFYRLKFSCQSTHNYLQPWGWGCECKTKLTKYHLKPFKRVESLFTHSCLPSFLYHP